MTPQEAQIAKLLREREELRDNCLAELKVATDDGLIAAFQSVVFQIWVAEGRLDDLKRSREANK